MNVPIKIATTLVAVMCALAFSSVPTLAANTGSIDAGLAAAGAPPTIVSVSPSGPYTVTCNPDGTATQAFTVRVSCANGVAELKQLDAQLQKGGGAVGSVVTVTSGAQVNAKTLDYSIAVTFRYYYTYGSDWTVKFTATTQGGKTATQTSAAITYVKAAGITIESPVSPSKLDFGTLDYGQTSSQVPSVVHNSANAPVSVTGAGSDFTSPATGASPIPIGSLYAGSTPMGGTVVSSLPNGGVGATPDPSYKVTTNWHVTVPAETTDFVLYGTYSTTVTLTATAL